MKGSAEILCIGDELLRGDLVDTNSAWLATRLGQLGFSVQRIEAIGDGVKEIEQCVRQATKRTRVLIISGGLGPTEDDRTAAAVAHAAGKPLERNTAVLEMLHQRFKKAGVRLTPNNEKQSFFPAGAVILPNAWGTAPGFNIKLEECSVFCLPGVSKELKGIFTETIEPLLRRELGARPTLVRTLKIFGLGESQIDDRLSKLLSSIDLGDSQASLHYRTEFPENHIILVVRSTDDAEKQNEAKIVLDRIETEIRALVGEHIFGVDDTTFSAAIVEALRRANATVALAESCTGGLVGDLLTRAPGSSDVFHLGVVAYQNQFKEKILAVPKEVLEKDGAVSQSCVEAMAKGVRKLAGTTFGVAVSGIAGPGGGTEDKPVGTVHFAIAGPDGVRYVHRVFPFDRQRVKLVSAYVALWLVKRAVGN
ncbi:MAG: competence/damage-inducible protein A [Pseudomonadota bacterium]